MNTVEVNMAGLVPLRVLEHRAQMHDFTRWERPYLEAIANELKPGDEVFDLGSEEGEFGAMAAKLVGYHNVHIFEPAKWYWPNIHAVWQANGFGPPAGAAVAFVADQPSGDGCIWKGIWPPEIVGKLKLEGAFAFLDQHDHIPRITLDGYAPERTGNRLVLMMDIEGCELLALRGAANLLANRRPIVFMEMHNSETMARFNTTKEQLLQYMVAHRYTAEHLPDCGHDDHWVFRPL